MANDVVQIVKDESLNAGHDRFARVFDVLELLVGHSDGMRLTEISRKLGLPTSSTHNLLQKMVSSDMLIVTSGLQYLVGPRALRFALRAIEGIEVRNIARRYLMELSLETGGDVYLAMSLGRKVSYVDRTLGTNPVSVSIRLGQALYLHATAVGKLYAAYDGFYAAELFNNDWPKLTEFTLVNQDALKVECARIRQQQYSISREESYIGVTGVAVPVFDVNGNIVAAIHRNMLQSNYVDDGFKVVIDELRRAALGIERELGLVRN